MYGFLRFFRYILVIFLLVLFSSSAVAKMTPRDYVDKYSNLAVKEMKRSGVPASITLSQGMLESNFGNSKLAIEANNHFGIKCHNDWTGKTMHRDDDRPNECFRSYKSVLESYTDHSNFLRERSRYEFLFELKSTDYKGWSYGLKKAGYATDPNYPKRLIKLIEDYELYKYDIELDEKDLRTNDDFVKVSVRKNIDGFVIDIEDRHEVKYNNGVKYIEVEEGDSFELISEEFGMRPWEIYTYNDLDANASVKKYRYLYIQPKKGRANRSYSFHILKHSETLHYLSQKYGVKLRKIYKFNNFEKGYEPTAGTKIYLRKKH